MIITIDGPSGTGKTTVAKRVAEALNLPYFDTGAMYRAVTWYLLKEAVPISDESRVKAALDTFFFRIESTNKEKRYFVNDADVTAEIRTKEVNAAVSEVSALACVRENLWKIQKNFGEQKAGVFEGRDMGSVVFPEAELKFFLTADPAIRAERRLKEIQQKLPEESKTWSHDEMIKELMRRDAYDSSRQLAPMTCPKGAYVIDTSHLSLDQVVGKIIKIHQKLLKKFRHPWAWGKMNGVYRSVLFLAWSLVRIFYRHRVYGLEHFFQGSGLIAANHTSYLDPPLVAVSWPEEIHFLAKESLFKPFLFGSLIRRLNAHPVRGDGGDAGVIKASIQIVKEGKKLLIFPEGGRSPDGELQTIKPGLILLMSKTEAPLLPVYVHGAFDIWGRGRKLPRFRGKTICVFGSPILWEPFAHMERKDAQVVLDKILKEKFLSLKEWLLAGAKGVPP